MVNIAILRGLSIDGLSAETYKVLNEKDELIVKYFSLYDSEVVHVFLENYDRSCDVFTCYYHFKCGKLIKENAIYNPDVLWNMTADHTDYIYDILEKQLITCGKRIAKIADNKLATYDYLSTYQPFTVQLKSFYDTPSVQNNFSDEVILKPVYGSKGLGIEKVTKKYVIENKDRLEKYGKVLLVQDLIDASQGYPGITEGYHDVRLYYIGDNFLSSVVRNSKGGDEFRACVNLGGYARPLIFTDLPSELIIISHEIISIIDPQKSDFYSLDFAYCNTNKKRYLIEVNSAPGFRLESGEELQDSLLLRGILKKFKEIL